MSDAVYERYKEALRNGHVAVLRGRLSDALAAYHDAASIAPDRALPRTSLGGVYLALGRVDDALGEFGTALERSATDEGAHLGRAEALIVAGRSGEAASTLDRLAEIQHAAGRTAEACDIFRRSLELEPTVARQRRYQELARALRTSVGDQEAEQALARALRILDLAEQGEDGDPASVSIGSATRGGERSAGIVLPGGEGSGRSTTLDGPDPGASVPWEAGERAYERGEEALDADQRDAARVAFAEAARAYGQARLDDAALEACHRALALDPDDAEVQLVLVELFLERGWRELAVDKLVELLRLVELDGDVAGHRRICRIAGRTFNDDPRILELCA